MASSQDRVNHECTAYTVECFDERDPRVGCLKPFHERLVRSGEVAEHAVLRRLITDRIRGVDHQLADQIGAAGKLRGLERALPSTAKMTASAQAATS